MRNKTLFFYLFLLGFILIVGFVFGWLLSAGIFVGMLVAVGIYNYKYSAIDELNAEVSWILNWSEDKLEEYGPEYTRFSDSKRLALLVASTLITLAVVVAGITGELK